MADLIQIRRDTYDNWWSTNPTLANGEVGIITHASGSGNAVVLNPLQCKVGDGSTNWRNLATQAWAEPGLSGSINQRINQVSGSLHTEVSLMSGSLESLEDNIGHYTCTTAGGTAAKVISAADAPNYTRITGGSLKIKFNSKNTAASGVTLKVGNAAAANLYYDGAPVTNLNTWEAGETVDVYFDGQYYMANNVSGGGTFATGQKVKNVGIDDEPTAGSDNLVKSGGVQSELALGAVYDVSAKNPTSGPNNDGKWESLSALLSDDDISILIPASVRKGGMSIKFIQSSDNKYVQYMLNAQTWTIDTSCWEKINLEKEVNSLNKTVNGLAPLTEYVGRLESTSALISYNASARYIVVNVNPRDSVELTPGTGGCFYYIVKEFTFNPQLPYSLILATGETSKHSVTEGNTLTYTMPSDAAYIILRGTISSLIINGSNVLKSIPENLKDTNDKVFDISQRLDDTDVKLTQKFEGIFSNQFLGELNTSGANILQSSTKKYVVIPIKGGQLFTFKRTNTPATSFYVVKEFTFNPQLPYNLVLATGETRHDVATTEYTIKLPNDAKYIIMLSRIGDVNYIPEDLYLDGENILVSYEENLDIFENINTIDIREIEGYYRIVSPYVFSQVDGWYATELVPVYSGDKIETNTTINLPYSTVGHLCFDKDGDYVQILNMVDGKSTITQEMYDAGVRFVGISYNKTDTPSPSLTIIRNTIKTVESKVDDINTKIPEINASISSIENKSRIEIINDGLYTFYVDIYNKTGGKVRYKFTRELKVWDSLTYTDGDGQIQTITDFTSSDAWNNDSIFDNNDNYIIQGNTNFICQAYGDTRHIGNGHGNEVFKVCKFFADGIEFSPTAITVPLECHEFRWIWKSEVYSPNLSGTNSYPGAYPRFDTNGNPIVNFTHYMEGILNDSNEMDLDNRICIKQNGFKFNAAFAAMLECYYGDFSLVSVATNESTVNSVANDGTATAVFSDILLSSYPNQLANKAVIAGNNFVVEQSIDVKEGTPNVHCEFYPDRLKIYFMPVKGYSYQPEDAWQPDEFNEGDMIRVLTHRKIDIKL